MQRNMITVDKILADLEHDKILARKAGQYGVAKGCTELQGRYLAMFTDRQIIDADQQAQLSEAEQREARRIAHILLMQPRPTLDCTEQGGYHPPTPALPCNQ